MTNERAQSIFLDRTSLNLNEYGHKKPTQAKLLNNSM